MGRVPGTAMFVVCCQDSHDREESAGDDSYAVLSITSECVRRGGARGSVGAPSPSAKQLRDAPRRHPASEEEAVEKARLQSLVDSFAKRAVRGCPCTYLDGMGRARIDALYRLDESLRRLTLLAKGDRSVIAECSIEDIQDIYLLEDDGEECFPPGVLRRLGPHERELLVMVVHSGGQGLESSFCALEESPESRDQFLESMRVLSIYAAHAPAAERGRLGAPPARQRGRPAR